MSAGATNDNDMNNLQRIKALERAIKKMRADLKHVETLLKYTPSRPYLKKQKGAIEKLIFMAQVELGKVRKKVMGKGIGNVE